MIDRQSNNPDCSDKQREKQKPGEATGDAFVKGGLSVNKNAYSDLTLLSRGAQVVFFGSRTFKTLLFESLAITGSES